MVAKIIIMPRSGKDNGGKDNGFATKRQR